MHTMEEKKGPRFGGSKVSEIANIFQAKAPPAPRDDVIAPLKKTQQQQQNRLSRSSEKIDAAAAGDSPTVTVVRTESHVTRFNNARAMFEKLGEEHKRDKVVPLQSTRSASNILDSRSRAGSANSESRDTKSQRGSRTPSPPCGAALDDFGGSVPAALNRVAAGAKKTNGFAEPETNGRTGDDRSRIGATKPAVPSKPERKFGANSKELIERQRNWTSHFSKTRSSRYNSDPNRNDAARLAVNSVRADADAAGGGAKSAPATRSASFSATRLKSPPTSPPPPPVRTEASRRPNVVRKERPASVMRANERYK